MDRKGYDPMTETYHAQHDWDDSASLSYTVLTAVSALTGDDPRAMEPLSDIVDLDALNKIFENCQRSGELSDSVMVTIEDCNVIVQRNGHVIVHPSDHV